MINSFDQVLDQIGHFIPGNIYPDSTIAGNVIMDLTTGTLGYAPRKIVELYEVELELHLQTNDIIWQEYASRYLSVF